MNDNMKYIRFVDLQIGQKFRCKGHQDIFVKTSYEERIGRDTIKFPTNCINLENNHRCSMGNRMLVELVDNSNRRRY